MDDPKLEDSKPSTPTLELDRVSFRGTGEAALWMRSFSGRLQAGELAEVRLSRHQQSRDLVSALLGLYDLESGVVRIHGHDWSGGDYAQHFRLRSRVGRVFFGSAWVNNMTVADNLLLPMLHHGVPEADAEHRIDEWTDQLAGRQARLVQRAMQRRPASVEPSMLQICQLIRAVCNDPTLLILERPIQYLADTVYEAFLSTIDRMRSRGVSVLCFRSNQNEPSLSFREPVIRWQLSGNALISGEDATS